MATMARKSRNVLAARAATDVTEEPGPVTGPGTRLSVGKLRDNRLLSGSATYLLSNVLNAAIPFALLPILTRYLSPAEYGEVAMFQMLVAGFGAVAGLSATGAAARKFYDADLNHQEMKLFIGSCFQIFAVSWTLCLIVVFAFHESVSRWVGLESSWILVAACNAWATFIIQMRMAQWQVRKEAWKYGLTQVAQSCMNIALSLALVIVFVLGASGRIWAQVVTSVSFALIALLLLYKDRMLGFAWRPRYLKEALDFGVPLVPHALGILLLGVFARVVINAELGLAEVGIYMVAAQVASAMGLLLDAINNAYVPWLFEQLNLDQPDRKRRIVKLTYWYFFAVLLLAGIAFLVGPLVIRAVGGERYAGAGEVIGWLALAQAFVGMYLMVTSYIFYSKKTGLLALVTVGSGLLNVALLWLLIGQWGILGAAIAPALAMSARFLLTWYVAQKRHPMPWFKVDFIG
jgi:O-antigen/teichoic acid export membrane protein